MLLRNKAFVRHICPVAKEVNTLKAVARQRDDFPPISICIPI